MSTSYSTLLVSVKFNKYNEDKHEVERLTGLSIPAFDHSPVYTFLITMALPSSISCPRRIPTLVLAISALFTSFSPNISFQGDAFSSNDVLQLTKNAKDVNLAGSAGRATYNGPVRLWDARTRKLTDFTTHFTFVTKACLQRNQIVAVEFDGKKDKWDPSDDHIGIDVNSVVSVASVDWKSSIKTGSQANAWVSCNSTTKNLSLSDLC
ncbi:hypothetical protein OIU77_003653 [Salix suchowensis]|uniref:Legume lectin domain-containing protein n=1 Tax=Salix suchowensis TaxID=1278906 RepID=A0ABQ9B2D0_9ROSI|nr:hypothetical protein OIU77_003653 [Salix suchowensis]